MEANDQLKATMDTKPDPTIGQAKTTTPYHAQNSSLSGKAPRTQNPTPSRTQKGQPSHQEPVGASPGEADGPALDSHPRKGTGRKCEDKTPDSIDQFQPHRTNPLEYPSPAEASPKDPQWRILAGTQAETPTRKASGAKRSWHTSRP